MSWSIQGGKDQTNTCSSHVSTSILFFTTLLFVMQFNFFVMFCPSSLLDNWLLHDCVLIFPIHLKMKMTLIRASCSDYSKVLHVSYIRDVTKLRWHSRGHCPRDKSYRQSFLDVIHYCTSLKFSRDRKWIDRSSSVICYDYWYGGSERRRKKKTEQKQMHRRKTKRKWTEIVKVKTRQGQLVVCNVFSCDRKDDRKDLLSSGVIYLRGRYRGEKKTNKNLQKKELFQVKTAFFLRLTHAAPTLESTYALLREMKIYINTCSQNHRRHIAHIAQNMDVSKDIVWRRCRRRNRDQHCPVMKFTFPCSTWLYFASLHSALLCSTRPDFDCTSLSSVRLVKWRHVTPLHITHMHLSVLTPRHFTLVTGPHLVTHSRQPHASLLFEDQYWYPEILPTTKIPSELLSSEFTTLFFCNVSVDICCDVSGAYNSPSSSISSVDSDSFHHAMISWMTHPLGVKCFCRIGCMCWCHCSWDVSPFLSCVIRTNGPLSLRVPQDGWFTSCFEHV